MKKFIIVALMACMGICSCTKEYYLECDCNNGTDVVTVKDTVYMNNGIIDKNYDYLLTIATAVTSTREYVDDVADSGTLNGHIGKYQNTSINILDVDSNNEIYLIYVQTSYEYQKDRYSGIIEQKTFHDIWKVDLKLRTIRRANSKNPEWFDSSIHWPKDNNNRPL